MTPSHLLQANLHQVSPSQTKIELKPQVAEALQMVDDGPSPQPSHVPSYYVFIVSVIIGFHHT
jgi:hypothetical protein